MLQFEGIRADTLVLFERIRENPFFNDFRLAGGTALALQIGHRLSIDLDFFVVQSAHFDQLNQEIEKLGRVRLIQSLNTIKSYVIEGIKVDFVNYAYPWISEPIESEKYNLAGMEDIVAMKIAAITGRGSRKDFIDLYFLMQFYSTEQMMSYYKNKFKSASLFLAFKSLIYFEDAEHEPMPEMLKPIDWDTVKLEIVSGFSASH